MLAWWHPWWRMITTFDFSAAGWLSFQVPKGLTYIPVWQTSRRVKLSRRRSHWEAEHAWDTNMPINDLVLSALHGFIIVGIFHLHCFCNTPIISCNPTCAHFLIYFVVKGMLLSLSLSLAKRRRIKQVDLFKAIDFFTNLTSLFCKCTLMKTFRASPTWTFRYKV